MGRRSMDELLTAFDPLHSQSSASAGSANPSPLFPAAPPTGSASSSSSASRTAQDTRTTATAAQHAPVSLSQAPLDLLSFDDALPGTSASSRPYDTISSQQRLNESKIPYPLQAGPHKQDDLLQELHQADQAFPLPSVSTPAGSILAGHAGSPPNNTSPTRPTPRQRRISSGFSPPRRLSKSGLMHDDYISQFRAQHASTSADPSSSHSPAIDISGHIPPSPSTQISDEPAVLFHPSSPPAGSSIDSLRHNSYFASPGRNATIPPPPQPSSSHGQSIFDKPVATSDRQRRTSSSDRQAFHTLNEGAPAPSVNQQHQHNGNSTDQVRKPSGSRAAFIQNALRGPPPPFSSPSLKQSTSSHPLPIPGPSSSQPHHSSSSQQIPSSPGSSSTKSKILRKPTFEFPSFSSLGSSTTIRSQSLPQPGASIREDRSGSNTPSPASSLIIDSDPLPSLVLKVTGAARESRRILTEDIADGIRMALPPRIKLCKSWTLLYSLDAHGTSLTTLYTRVQAGLQKSTGGCVLVVEDMEGGIFGAYVNEAFKKSESYYGNGECFLWKVEAFPPGDNFRVGPIVRSFRWTARNDYIILSDSNFLSVGGGDGKFGLWLDSSFDKGFTTSCPAFANEPLCSPTLIRPGVDGNPEGKFEIMAVECWAVG